MASRRDGKYYVATVELSHRQQVERGGKHPHPRRRRDGMKRQRGKRPSDVQEAGCQIKGQRESELNRIPSGAVDGMREREPVDQSHTGRNESRDWSSHPDIEKRGPRRDWALDADESSE